MLRSGDIDMRFTGSQRMLDGTKAHKRIQKASPEEYKPEVTLTYTFEYRGFEIKLDGRADGVIYSSSGIVVDEIKSTTYPLENIEDNHNPLHWAQAKCYAFMLARQQTLESVDVQLTYCTLEDDGIKQFRRTFTEYELTYFIYELFDKYIVWAEYESERIKKRDLNIKTLNFPFECYRIGQHELAAATYRAIVGRVQLFAQAPTGVGKTISTLFPAVKAIGEGQAQKIFYLTAKTITRQAAHDAFLKMRGLGSYFKAVTLTAKDKICPHPGTPCNPESCELARGYYDRVNDVLLSLLENESLITREIITAYAEKNKLCPFELSLDISLWADCIICDYNYAFDPIVYLRRFFLETSGDYIFLVDEAHNLVDRAREMYSATLTKAQFLNVKKAFKSKNKAVYKSADKLNTKFLDIGKICLEEHKDFYISSDEDNELYKLSLIHI